jgi:hypothetical protein
MKRKFMSPHNNLQFEQIFTIDGDQEEVARKLSGGGYSGDGYDINELLGVEVII